MTVGEQGDDIKLVERRDRRLRAGRHARACAAGTYKVKLPLVGAFQVENALVAAGLAIATGGEPARVFAALEKLTGAKGRLELAGTQQRRADLHRLRPQAGRAGQGARGAAALCQRQADRGVRLPAATATPASGRSWARIAAENADRVIVTDDNPRSENPAAIRAAILAAAPGAAEIGDRAEAIRAGIAELKTGDVLLIAGKGHETGQIVGDRVLPFSDHEAVAAALQGKVA